MSNDRPQRENMSIEEATISNMWGDCRTGRTLGTERTLYQTGFV